MVAWGGSGAVLMFDHVQHSPLTHSYPPSFIHSLNPFIGVWSPGILFIWYSTLYSRCCNVRSGHMYSRCSEDLPGGSLLPSSPPPLPFPPFPSPPRCHPSLPHPLPGVPPPFPSRSLHPLPLAVISCMEMKSVHRGKLSLMELSINFLMSCVEEHDFYILFSNS